MQELNSSSALLNDLENKLSAALIRRSYLQESIADLDLADDGLTQLRQAGVSEPLNAAVAFIRCHNTQEILKGRIECSIDGFKASVEDFDKARLRFDQTAQEIHLHGSLTEAHQETLTQLYLEVVTAQTNRDHREIEHIKLIHEFDNLFEQSRSLGKSVKDLDDLEKDVRLRGFRRIDAQIRAEDLIIDDIRSGIQAAKQRYKGAILRLEEISDGVRQLNNRT